jgi:hypothetical protein
MVMQGGAANPTRRCALEPRDTLEPRATPAVRKAVQYLQKVAQRETVTNLTDSIQHYNIWRNMHDFTKFTNRCFERSYTSYGLETRDWLLENCFRL